MNISAFYHQPSLPWLSISSNRSIEIKLQTAKDVKSVKLIYGDPYVGDFDESGWKWKANYAQMVFTGEGHNHFYFTIRIQAPQSRLKYCFEITGSDVWYYADRHITKDLDMSNIFQFDFLPYVFDSEKYQAPFDANQTYWYQIFPDRFNPNPTVDNWQDTPVSNHIHTGGTFKGIEEKLEYLSHLGITGIYLTPIFESKTVHKYDTKDYFKIDPHFGTEDDFISLVKKAHSLDIKIMLDAVFNHSGTDFFAWKEAQSLQSSYRDWYYFNKKGYETFSFAKTMPKLNTENPDVIEYFCKVGQYWIQKADIDGWRLDVANELSLDFIRHFRKAIKSIKPNALLLGEIWHDSNRWLSGDMFDSVMNYPFMRIANQYFIQHSITEDEFILSINDYLNRYPFEVLVHQFNLYDSHDTVRLINQADHNLERFLTALAFLYVSPGSPCIYYGTEIALKGGFDPDNRRRMIFEPSPTLHPSYILISLMIKLRKMLPPLSDYSQWSVKHQGPNIIVQWNTTTIFLNTQYTLNSKLDSLSDFGIKIEYGNTEK